MKIRSLFFLPSTCLYQSIFICLPLYILYYVFIYLSINIFVHISLPYLYQYIYFIYIYIYRISIHLLYHMLKSRTLTLYITCGIYTPYKLHMRGCDSIVSVFLSHFFHRRWPIFPGTWWRQWLIQFVHDATSPI